MPIYRYCGLASDGRRCRALIAATSFAQAKEKLQQRQIALFDLQKTSLCCPSLTAPQLLAFTERLSRLLSANIPLYQSCLLLEEQERRSPLHLLLLLLCDRLEQGDALHVALAAQQLDPIYCAIIRHGAKSGRLKEAFCRLTHFLRQWLTYKRGLRNALLYPLLLFALWLVALAILLLLLLPALQDLHPDPSGSTAWLFAASSHCRDHPTLWIAPPSALLLIASCWRRRLRQLARQIPGIKQLLRHGALLHLAHALSALLQGGLPLLRALALARQGSSWPPLQAALLRLEQRLQEGESLSQGLQREPLFPLLLSKAVALGEQSGELASSFSSLAILWEEQLERRYRQLQATLQPVLLLLVALLIGATLLAMLLPLAEMATTFEV